MCWVLVFRGQHPSLVDVAPSRKPSCYARGVFDPVSPLRRLILTYTTRVLCPMHVVLLVDQSVRDIMLARIEKAAGMSCDAIEPDNMSVSAKQNY